jgi:light-independent protochlorophyllide reductase subunit B
MKLSVWTYEGPPHVGAMRIATAMQGLHYILHAPQGDTYADLLFTMIERRDRRPPVTYTTFQARDLGKDTAELFQAAARDAVARFAPEAIIVGSSCTAELIQDDPGGLAEALQLDIPVVPLELPSYQKKENWGAAETFYQLVRRLTQGLVPKDRTGERIGERAGRPPSCNLLGATALGFRHRDDLQEVRRLLDAVGISVNVVAPWQARPSDLRRLPEADFNVVLYPEIAAPVATFLKRSFQQPFTQVVPIGVKATEAFVRELAELAGLDAEDALAKAYAACASRMAWYSSSVDATYLTGKRVFVFGDGTHALAAARVATEEFGFELVGLGSYSRESARELREAAQGYGLQALISEDYLEVEQAISEAQPDMVLGTQMERHIAKRLGIACAVISAPVHVQDFPARYSPQMGFEGANVLFDTWVHPLMMGLEEHLLGMFREDFEFHEGAGASHLGGHGAGIAASSLSSGFVETASSREEFTRSEPISTNPNALAGSIAVPTPIGASGRGQESVNFSREGSLPEVSLGLSLNGTEGQAEAYWTADAEKELGKIPFFVRKKARKNTEAFAAMQGISAITKDTLYEAKAHYGR